MVREVIELSVIIPTITGREESLHRTLRAYADNTRTPYELIVVENQPNWPAACNAGAKFATGDVLHFGADDLCPCNSWYNAGVRAVLSDNELPAPPIVWNYEKGGNVGSDDGPPGALTRFTRVPILTRAQYDAIGPWPEIIYFADVWISDRARYLGMQTRAVAGYEFVHYWHQTGRLDGDKKAMDDAYGVYQNLVGNLGY